MTSVTMRTSAEVEPVSGIEKVAGDWTVASAKARLSEVIDRALTQGPQAVSRRGRRAVVVVSAEEWERKTRRTGSLAEFFAASPLKGSGIDLTRLPDGAREIDL